MFVVRSVNTKDTTDTKARQISFSFVSIVSVVFMPTAEQLKTAVGLKMVVCNTLC